jgi:hypothetical protein
MKKQLVCQHRVCDNATLMSNGAILTPEYFSFFLCLCFFSCPFIRQRANILEKTSIRSGQSLPRPLFASRQRILGPRAKATASRKEF